jgi:hypothetical protein
MHVIRPVAAAAFALAACASKEGSMSTVPRISLTPVNAGLHLHYRACSDEGHISIEVGGSHPRAPTSSRVMIGTEQWSIDAATEQDLAGDPTIDHGLRTHTPALIATRTDSAITVLTTGIDRTELVELLGGLGSANGTGNARDHHFIDPWHLHLPWPAAFDHLVLSGDDEFYGGRFIGYSLTGGMNTVAPTPIAGLPFRWSRGDQPSDDHGRGPLIPAWHGEVLVGGVVLEVNAQGTRANEKTYLVVVEQILRAVAANPDAACRDWPGRLGYTPSSSDAVKLVAGELALDFPAQGMPKSRVSIGADGTIRANGRRIASIAVNGYTFAWKDGLHSLIGVLGPRGEFQYEGTGDVLSIDAAGTVTDPRRPDAPLIEFRADGTVGGTAIGARSARYTGSADGRVAAALVLIRMLDIRP